MVFDNRTQSGKLLGEELAKRKYRHPHIFALVRGGVPVAIEVAKKLNAKLDILVVRKLGVPAYPELGFGALAPDGTTEIDRNITSRYMVHINDVEAVIGKEMNELERRMNVFKARVPEELRGETAIIIDDGIATGATMAVAVKYLRNFNPDKIVVAVPVCPDMAESQFLGVSDEFVCLDFEEYFGSVGEFYKAFPQLSDEEVLSLINNYDVTS